LCKWNFGDNNTWLQGNCNPEHTYADTGIYQVTLVVQDENGCDSSITQNLVVEGSMTIYVPNSFSPDGDNLNDEFGPIGAYISEDDYQMMIFSRWGEEIFHSQSPDLKWDGEVRGTGDKAPVDVYTYYILAKDLQGSVREFKGFVLLLRKE
jgi:gliding motility-associated-like protein